MQSSVVFLGVKGSVIALDRKTGQQLWAVKLKGSDFVNVLLDGDLVLATTKGEAFCLNAKSGELMWNNSLPGMGMGLITIATSNGSSSLTAMREKQRQDEAAADAGTTAVIASS